MKLLYIYPQEIGKESIPPFEFMNTNSSLDTNSILLLDENSNPNSFTNLFQNVREYNPDLIFFLGKSIKSYKKVKEYSHLISSLNLPQILVGDLSVAYKSVLENTQIDYVIRKGFEFFTLEQILNEYNSGRKIERTKNIFFKNNEKIVSSGIKQESFDYDSIQFPNYDLIDMNYYLNNTTIKDRYLKYETLLGENFDREKKLFEIFASTGCEGLCTFCINRVSKIRRHSVDYVLNHIKFLKEKHNVQYIDFGDSSFTSDLNWTKEFIKQLKKQNLNLNYRIYGARTDQVNKEILEGLKDTGCISIYFGFESGSQNQLNLIRKGTTVEQNLEALIISRELKLDTPIQLITGFPEEDVNEMLKTTQVLKKNGFKVSKDKIRLVLPEPNTPIYSEFQKRGLILNEEEYLLSLDGLDTRNIWVPEIGSHLNSIFNSINN